MHNDEPALLDTLDRGSLIQEVGEAIACCTPPQVFGVHGDWGLGKTSFLHQVQWYLTGDCPQQPESVTDEMKRRADAAKGKDEEGGASTQRNGVHRGVVQAVWFDAWRYQNEAVPVVALLHEMRAQLAWRKRLRRSVSRNAEVLTRSALLTLEDVTKKIGFQYSKYREQNREWEGENLAAALPSHTLREHLHKAIEQLLPRKRSSEVASKLVVFIDDVDRCEPEAAYGLLEGLKIYLTLDNCVFVLGMNQKAIEEAIAQRMKGETGDDPTMRAAAYMEKLCQNVWRLPAVRRPTEVLSGLLEDTVAKPAVRDWIRQGIEAPEYPCLPSNPRRLKGLANLLGRLYRRLSRQEGESSDPEAIYEAQLLVIVACVYQFHHELHVRWEADPGLYDRIREWCGSVSTQSAAPDAGEDRTLPFLKPLTLPLQSARAEPTEPTPKNFETTFPDPTDANVFWIQSLILHLGPTPIPDHFERYLHGDRYEQT